MHIWKWVKGLTVFHAPDFTPFVAFRGMLHEKQIESQYGFEVES